MSRSMNTSQPLAFVTKSRKAWIAWAVAAIAWAIFAVAGQDHQIRTWAAYHFDFDKTAANYRTAQRNAHNYRQQLLAQIESAASAAEAEVRRNPGSVAKVSPELLEYEVAKAGKEARSQRRRELTHNTGNVYTDLMNEDALVREVQIDAPLPRPSSNWLFVLLAPPLVLALMVALVPPIIFTALRNTRGRLLVAVAILWPLIVLTWGFIFQWDNYFQSEQYAALLALPPALAGLAARLWRWACSAQP